MRTMYAYAVRLLPLMLWAVSAWTRPSHAQGAGDAPPYGIDKRASWTTSRITGTPDPPAPYRTVVEFPRLQFAEPLAMTSAPGTDRLFVAERYGKVFSFPRDPLVQKADLLLDLDKVVYGLAFHPQFARNGYFYVTYVLDPVKEEPLGTRVSRFRVRPEDPLRADPSSEKIIIQWPSGGHNGGCLKFGPDGYLYIATGDSAGIADEYLTGQDLSNLPGSILRIDVDHAGEGKAYGVPADNPFVGLEGARPEIWAYGLRQPWKMSFDRATGDLWTGNVGQDLWEQIFLIERGGNYGWSVMEGSHPFRPERKRGPTPFVPPIVEHDHAEFRSITGGFVYRGSRLEELRGAYIYGDYDTGKIWMLRYDRQNKTVTERRELLDSSLRLVGFAEDQDGELYLVDHMSGRISGLERNPAVGQKTDFPRKLSQTGLFTSVRDHAAAAGVLPYSVIAPQWMDGASKERLLALPGLSQIELDGITYPQPAPGAPHGWKFPNGTVAVETISMEMEQGNPSSRRRLETRILHYEKLAGTEEFGDQYWRGYTYVWNDDQTDATLLEDPRGLDWTLTIKDPGAPGGTRQQTWHFPSRAECTVCHNMAAKFVLGINTLQMNRDHDYGGVTDNQLRTFEHLGLFTEPLPERPSDLPRLADYQDTAQDLNQRARSYLHANCSHCHRKWGGGNADFRLLAGLPLEEMGIAGVRPAHGGFYIPDARILAPGDPVRSVLFYRMAKLGPGRMPRIGSAVVDERGLDLIYHWIQSLSTGAGTDQPVGPRPADAAWTSLQETTGDALDARAGRIDAMLATTSGAIRLMRAVDEHRLSEMRREEVIVRATQHSAAHVRDLFERYLPEEQRTKRLGNVIKPEEILALEGDTQRGKGIFFEATGVQCKSCHKIHGQGADVGPDLSEIGKKYDRARILDNILDPSKEIDPQYRVWLVQTEGGQVYSGLLVQKDDGEIILKDAENRLTRLAADEVAEMTPQQQSLMPDLLLRDMTAQQVADLTWYLGSLK